jgi:hypothetical protein
MARLRAGWSRFETRRGVSLLHSIQTGCEADPASYPMGTGGKAGVLSQMNPVHIVFNLNLNNTLPSTSKSSQCSRSFRFPYQNFVSISLIFHNTTALRCEIWRRCFCGWIISQFFWKQIKKERKAWWFGNPNHPSRESWGSSVTQNPVPWFRFGLHCCHINHLFLASPGFSFLFFVDKITGV